VKKFVLSAVLAAAGLIGFVAPASAATFTINFTGVVTSAFDENTFASLPGEIGKSVTGKIMFGGNSSDALSGPPQDEATAFDNTTYSFKVGSAPATTGSSNVSSIIFLHFGNDVDASFAVGPGGSTAVAFQLHWQPSSQLASLATFPVDDVAAAIFFGTPMSSAPGFGTTPGIQYQYTVTSFTAATTPLPASAGFFLAALGGLGVTAWRRRTAV
jgi:hypothetical protein